MSPTYEVREGRAIDVLKQMAADSVDAVVTDPPYEIGFMGNAWDRSGVAYSVELWREILRVAKPGAYLLSFGATRTHHRMVCAVEDAGFEIRDEIDWIFSQGFPKSALLSTPYGGKSVALKPAKEPICVARKPLVGSVLENLERFGTGALEIQSCRVPSEDPTKPGRWPSNLIHDGDPETLVAFPEAKGQQGGVTGKEPSSSTNAVYGKFKGRPPSEPRIEASKSAARFFYCAKATTADRNEGLVEGLRNTHATVKPTALMRYLCRLVCPVGGSILDPFLGSGSTGKAALLEGFHFVGIEKDPQSALIARGRLAHAAVQAVLRAA